MAHLLLGTARMRGWLLVPLIAASGCLYLGRLNDPPTVTLTQQTIAEKGKPVTLYAQPTDSEDGPSGLTVTLAVTDAATGQPLQACDYFVPQSSDGRHFTVTFYRTGMFVVTATATDSRHATGSAGLMIPISDEAPTFSPDAMLQTSSTENACHKNSAGDVITLGLVGNVTDPDVVAPGLGCNGGDKPLSYTWRISGAPSGTQPVLTVFDGAGCAGRTAMSGPSVTVDKKSTQVCLWTDKMLLPNVAVYTVVLEVSDGANVVTSTAATIPIAPNELPCITGTNLAIGSYVIDRTQPYTLSVASAVDDHDFFGGPPDRAITFYWRVSTDSDPTWRDVFDYALSSYTLDPTMFGVGEVVHVRVEAIDSSGDKASSSMCAESARDCDIGSCALPGALCHKWRTWDLELR